jgi:hypothetical protein
MHAETATHTNTANILDQFYEIRQNSVQSLFEQVLGVATAGTVQVIAGSDSTRMTMRMQTNPGSAIANILIYNVQ